MAKRPKMTNANIDTYFIKYVWEEGDEFEYGFAGLSIKDVQRAAEKAGIEVEIVQSTTCKIVDTFERDNC